MGIRYPGLSSLFSMGNVDVPGCICTPRWGHERVQTAGSNPDTGHALCTSHRVSAGDCVVRPWISRVGHDQLLPFQKDQNDMVFLIPQYHSWLVVWNIFYFPIYWEWSSQLTFIFFRGVAQPPTSYQCWTSCLDFNWDFGTGWHAWCRPAGRRCCSSFGTLWRFRRTGSVWKGCSLKMEPFCL